jgi:enoyl-CoA hydratase/carnithine racemase
MSNFADYKDRYSSIEMERRDGILHLRFHTNGGSFVWSGIAHNECAEAFSEIGRDHENRVIIMSGTGDQFCGPVANPSTFPKLNAAGWDGALREGIYLTTSLLNIEAVIISCINGPAVRHPEIPLLADIVLAAPEATFMDSGHFYNRMVPGDGVHFVFPLLLGVNRARYFLLTGQTIDGAAAHELGLVNELLPRDELLPRAWELAEQLINQNPIVLRYSRMLLTQELKKASLELLGYGLALEGLAVVHESDRRIAEQAGGS